MVLLRLVTSSLILLALAHPRLGGRTAADWRPVLALGVTALAVSAVIAVTAARLLRDALHRKRRLRPTLRGG